MGEKLGAFLKQCRIEKGYSLKKAKERTGISEAYLWQLENNKRGVPRPDILKKLADGYDVPAETLLQYAGYSVGPVDEKKEINTKKKVLFRDYDKLSDAGKKELKVLMRWLQEKDSRT